MQYSALLAHTVLKRHWFAFDRGWGSTGWLRHTISMQRSISSNIGSSSCAKQAEFHVISSMLHVIPSYCTPSLHRARHHLSESLVLSLVPEVHGHVERDDQRLKRAPHHVIRSDASSVLVSLVDASEASTAKREIKSRKCVFVQCMPKTEMQKIERDSEEKSEIG
eukprot:1399452-Rhodomonas_salina.1